MRTKGAEGQYFNTRGKNRDIPIFKWNPNRPASLVFLYDRLNSVTPMETVDVLGQQEGKKEERVPKTYNEKDIRRG